MIALQIKDKKDKENSDFKNNFMIEIIEFNGYLFLFYFNFIIHND